MNTQVFYLVSDLEPFAIGFFIGLIIDVAWWHFGLDKSSLDKKFKAHEHYHIGIEIGIIGILLQQPILQGVMFAFILAEWTQDHKFALQSGHFKQSTIIGIILFTAYVALLL